MFDGGDQRDEAARAGLTVDEFREWGELNARRCAAMCFRMAGCADRSPGLRGYRRALGFICIVPGDAAPHRP